MAEKNIVQLIKSFDINQLKPVVVVYGAESLLKRQLVEKIKNTGDTHILWGDETEYLRLKDIFSSSALFSEGNTAVLLEAEHFFSKIPRDQMEDFLSFLQKISLPDRLFLFIGKDKLPAKEPYKTLKNIGDIVVSAPLTPKAFYISVKNKIEKSGKKISDEALKKLVSMLKGDLYYAKQELEKLLIYVADRDEITVEDIENVVIPKTMENVFVFLDSFFSKQPSALKIFRHLISSSHHPFEIQSLLLNQLNKLLIFKTLLEKGKSTDFAFEYLKIKHPAMKGSIQKQSAMITKKEIISLIKQLYRLEKEQKIEYMDIYRTAEEFVARRVL